MVRREGSEAVYGFRPREGGNAGEGVWEIRAKKQCGTGCGLTWVILSCILYPVLKAYECWRK